MSADSTSPTPAPARRRPRSSQSLARSSAGYPGAVAARGPDHVFDLAIVDHPASASASIGISGSTVDRGRSRRGSAAGDATGLVVAPGFDIPYPQRLRRVKPRPRTWGCTASTTAPTAGSRPIPTEAPRCTSAGPTTTPSSARPTAHGWRPSSRARADLRDMQPEYTPGTTADDLLAHAALAAEHEVPLCATPATQTTSRRAPISKPSAVRAARETDLSTEHINSNRGDRRGTGAHQRRDRRGAVHDSLRPLRVLGHVPRRLATRTGRMKYGIGGPAGGGTAERLTEQTFDGPTPTTASRLRSPCCPRAGWPARSNGQPARRPTVGASGPTSAGLRLVVSA